MVQLQIWKSASSLLRELDYFDRQENKREPCNWINCTLAINDHYTGIAEHTRNKLAC